MKDWKEEFIKLLKAGIFKTNFEIDGYAYEHNLPISDVWQCFLEYEDDCLIEQSIGTPCEGCKYVITSRGWGLATIVVEISLIVMRRRLIMVEISKPLTHFQSCNCCGRYNKCGPGTEQMYKSLCKNIREYVINGMCIRLCEDCARQLRDQLNEILDEK